jgi:hypothetical protein
MVLVRVIYLPNTSLNMNLCTQIFSVEKMKGKGKGHKNNQRQDEKDRLISPKQFIAKNKKENLVLEKILKKMNLPLENDQKNDNS